MKVRRIGFAVLLALGVAGVARADPPPRAGAADPGHVSVAPPATPVAKLAAIRTGSHPTFGRLAIDLPPGATGVAHADGTGGVLLRLSGATFGPVPGPPRNVAAITVQGV